MQKHSDITPTSSIQSLQVVIHYMMQHGITMQEIERELNLSKGILQAVEKRLSFYEIQKIWAFAIKQLDDPHLGIHVGSSIRLFHLGVVGYVLLNAPTIKEALIRLCRYHTLISEGTTLHVLERSEGLGIKIELFDSDNSVEREPVDAFFIAIITILHEYVGAPIWPYRVELRYAIDDTGVYKKHYGVYPDGKSESNSIWFNKSIVEQTIMGADTQLFVTLKERAQSLLDTLESDAIDLITKRVITNALLAYEKPTIESVAKHLEMSVRTLQYKLAQVECSFRELLESARKTLALNSLQKGLPSADVAFLLGYSEVSSFNKAFKKWMDCTPGEYKSQTH